MRNMRYLIEATAKFLGCPVDEVSKVLDGCAPSTVVRDHFIKLARCKKEYRISGTEGEEASSLRNWIDECETPREIREVFVEVETVTPEWKLARDKWDKLSLRDVKAARNVIEAKKAYAEARPESHAQKEAIRVIAGFFL